MIHCVFQVRMVFLLPIDFLDRHQGHSGPLTSSAQTVKSFVAHYFQLHHSPGLIWIVLGPWWESCHGHLQNQLRYYIKEGVEKRSHVWLAGERARLSASFRQS